MNNDYDEKFCLKSALSAIRPLLPKQGPIKDFIHLNLLQDFIDMPFDEATSFASRLFGSKTHMDIHYYRQKYKLGEISNACLDEAIEKYIKNIDDNERKIIHAALFNFIEINDEKTFYHLIKKKNISLHEADLLINSIIKTNSDIFTEISIRKFLNKKLNCQMEHDVNIILFRLIGVYLDQGVSLWPFLENEQSFFTSVSYLTKKSILPIASFVNNNELLEYFIFPIEESINKLLHNIMSSSNLFFDYIKESLLDHRGWSGMINVIEENSKSLAKPKKISLQEVLLVKLALEWQFIKKVQPAFVAISESEFLDECNNLKKVALPKNFSLAYFLLQFSNDTKKFKISFLNTINQNNLQKIWHHAFEQSYYQSVFTKFSKRNKILSSTSQKKFQAVFCIDDREGSFRRHLEKESLEIETFAYPGFFGIDCYFKAHKKDLLDKLCPVPVIPKHIVMEKNNNKKISNRENNLIELASFISLHGSNSIFLGFISAYTLGHLSLLRLLFSFFHPFKLLKTKEFSVYEEKTTLLFERKNQDDKYEGLFLGYSHEEMAERVYNVLKSIGLYQNFSSMVFIIGHGSSSVNNPHFASYDCGACSGRAGSINARVFALMANIIQVRELVKKKGISIPHETIFVGGYHDTCTDKVNFFDLEKLSFDNKIIVEEFYKHIYEAGKNNSLERCKIFALVSPHISGEKALREVEHRGRSLFEPRPELGHINNALCIIGRRARTYGEIFLRRAFFQSYDPFIDNDASILTNIISAAIPVCGGINLDYFFSRIDPAIFGCGTKLSHNVCSLLGVGNGLDDDLRTGLPIQMTEIHDPIRLLIIIEQIPEKIIKSIVNNPSLIPWVINGWVNVASLDLNSNKITMLDLDLLIKQEI